MNADSTCAQSTHYLNCNNITTVYSSQILLIFFITFIFNYFIYLFILFYFILFFISIFFLGGGMGEFCGGAYD